MGQTQCNTWFQQDFGAECFARCRIEFILEKKARTTNFVPDCRGGFGKKRPFRCFFAGCALYYPCIEFAKNENIAALWRAV